MFATLIPKNWNVNFIVVIAFLTNNKCSGNNRKYYQKMLYNIYVQIQNFEYVWKIYLEKLHISSSKF